MKRKHAGAQSRKHGCCRRHKHKSVIRIVTKKTGAKFAMCDDCLRSQGRTKES